MKAFAGWAGRGGVAAVPPSHSLMVVENEKVVGLLTAGNIGELLALGAAGRQTGPTDARAGGGASR
jgi:hypothetical protein